LQKLTANPEPTETTPVNDPNSGAHLSHLYGVASERYNYATLRRGRRVDEGVYLLPMLGDRIAKDYVLQTDRF